MRNVIRCLILLVVTTSCNRKSVISDGSQIVFSNVNVVSVEDGEILRGQDVVVQDSKIIEIRSSANQVGGTVIDGTGKYLMPGLTEMHAHIPVADETDVDVQETLFLYLSQGITTIRGMLGNPYHLTLRRQVEGGTILSPRIYTSSPSMNGNSVTTAEEAVTKVKRYKSDGYDFLKIHPGIQLDVWTALEETAKEVDMSYAGHVPVDVGIRRALKSGYATVDHMDGFLEGLVPISENVDPANNGFFGYNFADQVDMSLLPDLVTMAVDNEVCIVATETLFTRWFSLQDGFEIMAEPEMKYVSSKVRYAWRQSHEQLIGDPTFDPDKWLKFNKIRKSILKEMDKQGVNFLLGSDAPQVFNVPGFSIHREMHDMSEAGINSLKILQSGTIGPASFFGASEDYGRVKEGMSADLILCDGNPLESLEHAADISGVMVRGKWLSRQYIDERLLAIELRHAEEP